MFNCLSNERTQKAEQEGDGEGDEEVVVPFPDLMDVARCLESGGVSPFNISWYNGLSLCLDNR